MAFIFAVAVAVAVALFLATAQWCKSQRTSAPHTELNRQLN